jgi:SAM-dependent methyltransferase
MGFASFAYDFCDTLTYPEKTYTLVVGPGDDSDDTDYWRKHGPVDILSPDPFQPKNGCRVRTALLEEWHIEREVYDVVWATHVLEHSRNPGEFLDRCYDLLAPGGHFFVAVPPFKPEVVCGHMSLWTMGLLWYHLILAGFDVHNGHYKISGYNLFAHVRKPSQPIELPALRYDAGDIEALHEAELWPKGADIYSGFDGMSVVEHNWPL